MAKRPVTRADRDFARRKSAYRKAMLLRGKVCLKIDLDESRERRR